MPNRYAAALLDPSSWAPEPDRPAQLELPRFARALRAVCAGLTSSRSEQYARWLQASAEQHEVDPFLLAALMSHASQCKGKAEEMQGIGLTGIQPEMYKGNVEVDMLQYLVQEGDQWTVRAKLLGHPLTTRALENPQVNIEWAAALLSMWREQHDAIDAQFEQASHRHYVSHFLWGDRVQSSRAEDSVFTARRRLLEHYGDRQNMPTRKFRNIEWGAPLEGSPRIVSSKPGADRDRGLRMHRGVDVESAQGEPVLAMADGKVTFAGVDLPGRGSAIELSPENIGQVPASQMGAGGRYVCITHAPSPVTKLNADTLVPEPAVTAVPREADGLEEIEEVDDGAQALRQEPAKSARIELPLTEIFADQPSNTMVSCYMHLDATRVHAGETVARGTIIGTVGRTGCKESPAHLHLEMKSDRELFDARDVLSGILVGDPPWRSTTEERRARRRARAEGLTSRAMNDQAAEPN